MGEVVEIFVPVFLALILHSGIIRLFDEIQMYFVSKRVSGKVQNILEEMRQEQIVDEELEDLLRFFYTKENQKKEKNDPNGEWKYLD